MADYNPKTVSAYQQYASSMKAGGGGTNLSGSGAKAPPKMQTEYGMRKGLGSPTSRLDKKGYTPTTSLSTASGRDYVDNVSSEKDLPSANPAAILYSAAANANIAAGVTQTPSPLTPMNGMSLYSLQKMTEVVPQVTPYLYRMDMQEQAQDLVEQAMGYEPPLAQMTPNRNVWDYEKFSSLSSEDQDKAAEALQIVGERKMTPSEIKQFQPLIDMANEIANETITVEELAPLTQMDQEAKLKDILEVIESGGLSRISNIREVRSDNAVDPFTGLPIGNNELGYVPTGSIEDAVRKAYNLDEEDYNEADYVDVSPSAEAPEQQGLMSRPSFTESQPEDSMLGGLFNVIPDAFQVSNWLTGGNQLDGTQGEEPSPEPELGPEQGPILYPSNERSVITYARDIYPDNPKAAAALAATIQFEGMENAEEDVSSYSWKNITSSSSPAGWLKKSITDSNKPWAKKRTNKLYQLYGGKPKTDADGNTIPLTREPTKEELKAVQRQLKERGLYKGAIDGIFGRGSKAALKEFQGIQNSTALSGDYPKMPENGSLDEYTAMFFDVELRLYDHKGSPMIEYERPTNPVVPAGEKVVDITYNPYYRANGYSDQLRDVSKEGLEGNTPGAGTFRGRGPVQITNKTMYEKLRNKVRSETGVDIMRNPSAVANDLAVSKAATAAFLNEVGFDKLSPKEALKVINPLMPSSKLNKRLEAYEKYLEEMQD
jgi:peptidoglycan hydrolase-like protein with peptidoglycan-binding domain